MNYQNALPPRIGLTKLTPILRLFNISRGTFKKGVVDGTYPPPRVPAGKPGASDLWDAAQIGAGFTTAEAVDVDGFISFSLSVHNRRKSRAGWAFGNHVEAILKAHDVRYTREATTEKRNGPDFLFPGEAEYHDPSFSAAFLTMLGAKTSCKDRWRQVLAEANRIDQKHLLTLQPGISEGQTTEMQAENLRLVVPRPIFSSYQPAQQDWLLDVEGFVGLVKERQA